MKVFISQPMTGKTDEEIKKERSTMIEEAKRLFGDDVEIIDSFFEGAPYNAAPLWFLGKAIQLLSTADAAMFAKGWSEARGCKMEYLAAKEYGIRIIE
jgi:hypothetical protein